MTDATEDPPAAAAPSGVTVRSDLGGSAVLEVLNIVSRAAKIVLPECVESGLESEEHYVASMRKAHTLSLDVMQTDRERRWEIAEAKLTAWHMVSPNSVGRKRWDFLQVVFLLYVAVVVPYRIGFTQDTVVWTFWFMFDVVVDVYFMMDVFLSFKTGYVDDCGELKYKTKGITKNYLKTWFAVDCASCLPVNYVALIPGLDMNKANARSNRMLRLLRLLRLLKLLRLLRINRLIQRYENQFHELMTSVKLLKLVIFLSFMGHWLGCLWYFSGEFPGVPEEVDYSGKMLEGWPLQMYRNGSADRPYAIRYSQALYWSIMTMTTVGYGDIAPTTTVELMCAIFAMLIGGFVFGLIVGNLSDMARRANPAKRMFDKKVGCMLAFLHEREVSAHLCKRISRWHSLDLMERTPLLSEDMLLKLPVHLRNELAVELGYVTGSNTFVGSDTGNCVRKSILHNVPFFTDLDPVTMIMLCMRLKFETVHLEDADAGEDWEEGDAELGALNRIMEEGKRGTSMWVISSGELVVSSEGERLGVLGRGDFFGELAVLRTVTSVRTAVRPPLYKRTATLISETASFYTLHVDDFADICEQRPALVRTTDPFIQHSDLSVFSHGGGVKLRRQAFEAIDADGGGTLDKEEVRDAFHAMGRDLSPGELDEVFTEMDKGGQGEVEFEDFNAYFMGMHTSDGDSAETAIKTSRMEQVESRMQSMVLRYQNLELQVTSQQGKAAKDFLNRSDTMGRDLERKMKQAMRRTKEQQMMRIRSMDENGTQKQTTASTRNPSFE